MAILKRITASLSASVDRLVGELENHDAAVAATLRQARERFARAKVRLSRLQREGERLRQGLADLRDAEQRWSERALRSADSDEQTALDCLARHNACARQAAEMEERLRDHQLREKQLQTEIERAGRRLEEIAHQRQLMRSREAAAEAVKQINRADIDTEDSLDDAFERWETRITEVEIEAGSQNPGDPLEDRFRSEEDREELRLQLDALRRGEVDHE